MYTLGEAFTFILKIVQGKRYFYSNCYLSSETVVSSKYALLSYPPVVVSHFSASDVLTTIDVVVISVASVISVSLVSFNSEELMEIVAVLTLCGFLLPVTHEEYLPGVFINLPDFVSVAVAKL